MEAGPASRSRSRSSQRAGVSVRSSSGRFSTDSSSTLAKAAADGFNVALEVVAQLLDRLELVREAAPAHHAPAGLVHHAIAIREAIAIFLQLDAHHGVAEDHDFGQ